jgi:hypothetical protein
MVRPAACTGADSASGSMRDARLNHTMPPAITRLPPYLWPGGGFKGGRGPGGGGGRVRGAGAQGAGGGVRGVRGAGAQGPEAGGGSCECGHPTLQTGGAADRGGKWARRGGAAGCGGSLARGGAQPSAHLSARAPPSSCVAMYPQRKADWITPCPAERRGRGRGRAGRRPHGPGCGLGLPLWTAQPLADASACWRGRCPAPGMHACRPGAPGAPLAAPAAGAQARRPMRGPPRRAPVCPPASTRVPSRAPTWRLAGQPNSWDIGSMATLRQMRSMLQTWGTEGWWRRRWRETGGMRMRRQACAGAGPLGARESSALPQLGRALWARVTAEAL